MGNKEERKPIADTLKSLEPQQTAEFPIRRMYSVKGEILRQQNLNEGWSFSTRKDKVKKVLIVTCLSK